MNGARGRAGDAGEDAAAAYLLQQGLTVLARGYRAGRGELDIIAVEGGELVFVEVKASTGRRFGEPAERVDARKRRQLVKLAQRYVNEHGREDDPVRFDVVGVVLSPGGVPEEIEHIRNAFVIEG